MPQPLAAPFAVAIRSDPTPPLNTRNIRRFARFSPTSTNHQSPATPSGPISGLSHSSQPLDHASAELRRFSQIGIRTATVRSMKPICENLCESVDVSAAPSAAFLLARSNFATLPSATGYSGAASFDSVSPISRVAAAVHDRNDKDVVVLDRIEHCKGESPRKTASDIRSKSRHR